MTNATASERYTSVAVALHWVIAIALIIQLYVGFFHDDFPREVRGEVMSAHKSLGITVLLLSVARLVWRLMHRPPPLPEGLKPLERALSHAVHWGLYVVMIGAPLAGWAMSSASPKVRPIPFWGAEFPALPLPRGEALQESMAQAHWALGLLGVLLIALHMGGALKHRFIDGHDVMWRMIPFLKAPK